MKAEGPKGLRLRLNGHFEMRLCRLGPALKSQLTDLGYSLTSINYELQYNYWQLMKMSDL